MKTWSQILKRAAQVLREEGAKSLFFKVLGETVYRRLALLERPLDQPAALIAPRLPVTMGLLDDPDEYRAFRPDVSRDEVCRRLSAGYFCFVARYQGRIVAALWSASGQAHIDYLDCEFPLSPGEVYLYEALAAPECRGQNVTPALGMWAMQHMGRMGYRRAIGAVMPENKLGLRLCEKAGLQPFGRIGYWKIGPWRRDFCRTNPGRQPLAAHGPAYWDRVAGDMAAGKHYLDPFLGALKRQVHLELIARWTGAPRTGRALKTDLFEEAGGPDAFLTDMAHDGVSVVGIDVSPAIVGRARQRDEGRRAQYVAADVRRLPFASGAFCLIVSPSTLDHFSASADLGRGLRELARVLEPGGQAIVTLDNRQNVLDPLLRLLGRLGRMPYYLGRSYTVRELRAELAAAGLSVQETTAILHNPRLVAVAAVAAANGLRWPPLVGLVQRALTRAQRLERTRWRYYSGSFVAARGSKGAEEQRSKGAREQGSREQDDAQLICAVCSARPSGSRR
jgi:SAM-dependent methyltransferase